MPASRLTPLSFVRFYAPLAAASVLLTATNPLLTAALARSVSPTVSLAGFGVAFALTGVIYSPLLVVQQIAAARILQGGALAPLWRLTMALGAFSSALIALLAFTGAGDFVLGGIVGVHGAVLEQARFSLAFLWPVPLLTGVRSMHQGRLVAWHLTRPIAAATGIRTLLLAAVAFALSVAGAGAWLGGAAFTTGLAFEALVVALTPSPSPSPARRKGAAGPRVAAEPGESAGEEDLWRLLVFSFPLMLNVMLWWGTPLLINSVLARTPEPDLALAAFAVVESVAWFLAAPVGQFQQASIALVQGRESYLKVRRWAAALSVGVFLILVVAALPGVREVILTVAFRPDASLLATAGAALPLAAFYPILYGHRQYVQGLFVRAGCTGWVGRGAVIRVMVIALAAWLLLEPLGGNGAVLGVALGVIGLAAEALYLELRSHSSALPALEDSPVLPPEAVPP